MNQQVLQYKSLEQKIQDLKEISILVKQNDKNSTLLPQIHNKIRSLIFQQARLLK